MSTNMAPEYQCAFCPFRAQELDVVQQHAETCTGTQPPAFVADETTGAAEDPGTSSQEQENAWSQGAITQLIESYQLHQHRFLDGNYKKYQVWRLISSDLRAKGYAYDGAACDQKMRSLKRRYKLIKENTSLSGRDALRQWQYFNVMDALLTGDPAIDPLAVQSCIIVGTRSLAAGETRGAEEDPGTSSKEQNHVWSHKEILLLIESYRLHQHSFLDRNKKKYHVWQDISNELKAKGYAFDGIACDQKMRSLKRRYKLIKDKTRLSGRDALNQWQYFSVMDDLLGAVDPLAVQTCNPVDSPSSPTTSTATGASDQEMCSTPSPAPSPSRSRSPSPCGDSTIPPQPKRRRVMGSAYAEAGNWQGKPPENLVSQNQELRKVMEELLSRVTAHALTHSEEKQRLQKKTNDLHQQLLKQQEDHHRENREMLQQHCKEINELHLRYQGEIKELQLKILNMQQQHQQQLVELMLSMNMLEDSTAVALKSLPK